MYFFIARSKATKKFGMTRFESLHECQQWCDVLSKIHGVEFEPFAADDSEETRLLIAQSTIRDSTDFKKELPK